MDEVTVPVDVILHYPDRVLRISGLLADFRIDAFGSDRSQFVVNGVITKEALEHGGRRSIQIDERRAVARSIDPKRAARLRRRARARTRGAA